MNKIIFTVATMSLIVLSSCTQVLYPTSANTNIERIGKLKASEKSYDGFNENFNIKN